MFVICKELFSGSRKLLKRSDLLILDSRKMTYCAVPTEHEFKKRTDYGRLKQGEKDDVLHVYKYWVIVTTATEDEAKALIESGDVRMPAYSPNGREKLPVTQFNNEKVETKKKNHNNNKSRKRGSVVNESSIVKKMKSQDHDGQQNDLVNTEDGMTESVSSSSMRQNKDNSNAAFTETISQLTVPSKDNNLCTNDANIITDTDATSHKMNAENNLADEESTTDEEIPLPLKNFLQCILDFMGQFAQEIENKVERMETLHTQQMRELHETHKKNEEKLEQTIKDLLKATNTSASLHTFVSSKDAEDVPQGYVDCGEGIVISEKTIFEIWITQNEDALRTKLSKMVNLMFPTQEKRCYMYVTSDIPAKEKEKSKCSVFPTKCLEALLQIANDASAKVLRSKIIREQGKYLAKNKDVPEEQRKDRLLQIKETCEAEETLITSQMIRSNMTKVLEYERRKRPAEKTPTVPTSEKEQETPNVSRSPSDL